MPPPTAMSRLELLEKQRLGSHVGQKVAFDASQRFQRDDLAAVAQERLRDRRTDQRRSETVSGPAKFQTMELAA